MGVIGTIIGMIIVGLIAGAIARLVVPGKQHISIPMTILLGVIGSFVGGFLGFLIFRHDLADGFFQPAGIIGSIIGAIIVLLIYVRVTGRSSRNR
ncbi:GlsB/YeaQ/YmgE family stress response membrane protein [Curtobacterium aurantiacum]|uniref:GlsB/YeaQ/YmgE family stress response membrane protein n=1 Tax=Curtobacterium aurantiacum TaxID=3236919 RepID=A0ABS5VE06_9MICO|nr:GlsB/YeaQ/YmgE family stress response membrane protein [Curtobacterium flaccumfaciens]MBT1545919.1 GlsB/YeaQ/YmgE family stress response membrane protein [Curtobacterium flaccumfaciens pv. flaccumfaciens]MBT1587677.1 GlsB/YeaQ/YmgE family stress response membrane protein [Curtobacterium flaccumfaciens pv. flaccumfaciens]MBT1676206.1 GlsB/YeaQ/YmgE family stress response membrane protein [Curtobacterium flaccumfaciens pv. flaccumfaciens]MBT1678365.1 GlsB/YeaQ/YmgE family stress response membr